MYDSHDERAGETSDLFDVQHVRNYVHYVRGSIRRRKGLALLVLGAVVSATLIGLLTFPRYYHAEAKILAQRSAALPIRGDQPGVDTTTRSATETIMRHDNLIGLIKQTDLINHYNHHRAPVVRIKDAVFGLFHTPSEADEIDNMIERLEKRVYVWLQEGTVNIGVDWPDAQMAYRLAEEAQQSFLEARHVEEVQAISESVAILQNHATGLRADIDSSVDALRQLRAGHQPHPSARVAMDSSAPASPTPAPAPRASAEPDAKLAKLKVAIAAKERAIADLEDFRRHRRAELQAHLDEQRAVYTERHPIVMDLQQTIASLGTESGQVVTLRKELAALEEEYDREAGVPGAGVQAAARPSRQVIALSVSAPPPELPGDILSLERESGEERDPAMVYARGQLRDAMDKYGALRSQIQAAQIELQTAEAAFKYRYSVVKPAQVPKHVASPNAPAIMLAALFGGLLVALIAAVGADIRNGRIIEGWQIERMLERPVLGAIDVPALAEHSSEAGVAPG
jgi:capsular polysaccharide biosynthesis protein